MLTLATVLYFSVIALWPALAIVALVATRGGSSPGPRLARVLALSRRVLGGVMVSYAVVKFAGIQLTRQALDARLSELSAPELFWYFFGYSPKYVVFIASAELLCGALLLWRRTDRLGVVLGAALLANIASLDFAYEVGRVAFWAAGLFVGCLANIVAERAEYLRAVRVLVRDPPRV